MKSKFFTFGIGVFLLSIQSSNSQFSPIMPMPTMGMMQTGCPNVDNILGTTKFISETVAIMQEMNLRDFAGREIEFLESGMIQCNNFCASDPATKKQVGDLGAMLSMEGCSQFNYKFGGDGAAPDSDQLRKDSIDLYCNIVWHSQNPNERTDVPQTNVGGEVEDCTPLSMAEINSPRYQRVMNYLSKGTGCVPSLAEAADRVLPGGSGRPLDHPELRDYLRYATAANPNLAQNPALTQAVSMVTADLPMSPMQEKEYMEFIHKTALTSTQFDLLFQNQQLMAMAPMCPNLTPASLKTIAEQNIAAVNQLEAGKIDLKASAQALADASAAIKANPLTDIRSLSMRDPNSQGAFIGTTPDRRERHL